MGPAYNDAFIAAFQQRSTPDNVASADPIGLVRVEVCCSSWVTTLSFEAQSPGAEMLKDAFVASALNLLSIKMNDPALSASALIVHARSLRALREALVHFATNQASPKTGILYATAMTLALSELLVNKSWENFAKHVLGIGALIQHEGSEVLTSLAARNNFYGYRSIQAPFLFIHRRGSFLAKKEWIDFPWREEHTTANHPFHTLLDIAFQIPAEMEKFDKTTHKTPQVLRIQLGTLNAIAAQLLQWISNLLETSSTPILSTETALWDGLHDSSIKFSDVDVASSYTFFAGVQVALCNLMREVMEELNNQGGSEQELLHEVIQNSFKWSKIVFQCLEYFIAQDRKVIDKLICLFPFDMAWGTIQTLSARYNMDVTKELLWCESTATRLEEAGFPLLNKRHNV